MFLWSRNAPSKPKRMLGWCVTWRCPRKGCQKELSLRGGNFFERYLFDCTICLWCSSFLGSHLSLSIILRIIHLWSTKTPVGKTMTEVEVHLWSTCMNYIDTFKSLKVSDHTAVDWYNFIRDVCAQYFIDHPAVIGGPGAEVEIDESKFGK